MSVFCLMALFCLLFAVASELLIPLAWAPSVGQLWKDCVFLFLPSTHLYPRGNHPRECVGLGEILVES